jgi:hypothetical protein
MEAAKNEMNEKIRAAIKDRATWFALLYRAFKEALPEKEVQRLARKAIFEFGQLKAKKDPQEFSPEVWVQKHADKGSALVFDSDIEIHSDYAVQQMKSCPLVEAWQEIGCSEKEIALLCDIAMEGDRGRAAAHGVEMVLNQTIGKGDLCCRLVIKNSS